MSHSLFFNQSDSRKKKYEELYPQLIELVRGEADIIANMANVSSALREVFGFFWVGFYLVKEDELVLGPFQGSVACTRIKLGKGVCGTAWQKRETLIVPDVNNFVGHIACSSLSQSEVVVPVFSNDNVIAVLDVDSDKVDDFTDIDRTYLEKIAKLFS